MVVRKLCSDTVKVSSHGFVKKISNYGLDLTTNITGQQISTDIRTMERELTKGGAASLQTEPTTMSETALATAIQRQMDAIAQIRSLMDENNLHCNALVEASMKSF